MIRNKRIQNCILLLFIASLSVYAQDLDSRHVRDDSQFRNMIKDPWFTDAPAKVAQLGSSLRMLPSGERIELRSEHIRDELLVILARERGAGFPGWAQGSWVLSRNYSDGRPIRIRYFPRSDPNIYIQFKPYSEDRSLLDFVVYDGYIIRSLQLPYSIEALYTKPVEDVFSFLGPRFPRHYIDPPLGNYKDIRSLVSQIRSELPNLQYRDDGALDKNGVAVFIENSRPQGSDWGLNCSGFVKWLVDGLLKPISGEALSIAQLKIPDYPRGSGFTEPYEEQRDPFFGLDWNRNLAAQAGRILRSPNFTELEQIEVQECPVSAVHERSTEGTIIRPYPSYLKDAGFGIEGLYPLLYSLAVDHPSWFYLASINAEQGSEPRLRQHYHVAALMPYFTETGIFSVAVFESASETDLRSFIQRYPAHHVHLVRIPAEPVFLP